MKAFQKLTNSAKSFSFDSRFHFGRQLPLPKKVRFVRENKFEVKEIPARVDTAKASETSKKLKEERIVKRIDCEKIGRKFINDFNDYQLNYSNQFATNISDYIIGIRESSWDLRIGRDLLLPINLSTIRIESTPKEHSLAESFTQSLFSETLEHSLFSKPLAQSLFLESFTKSLTAALNDIRSFTSIKDQKRYTIEEIRGFLDRLAKFKYPDDSAMNIESYVKKQHERYWDQYIINAIAKIDDGDFLYRIGRYSITEETFAKSLKNGLKTPMQVRISSLLKTYVGF